MFTPQPTLVGSAPVIESREKASRSEAQPSGALDYLACVHHVNLMRPSKGAMYAANIAQNNLARAVLRHECSCRYPFCLEQIDCM